MMLIKNMLGQSLYPKNIGFYISLNVFHSNLRLPAITPSFKRSKCRVSISKKNKRKGREEKFKHVR